jgi:hypothetical protein
MNTKQDNKITVAREGHLAGFAATLERARERHYSPSRHLALPSSANELLLWQWHNALPNLRHWKAKLLEEKL